MEQNVLNTDLTGKVAVVTGASGTLCSIFAKALARAGAKVALLGRNMEKLKALADEIEAAYEFADSSPYPDPSEAFTDVYSEDNERCVAR